jgi:NADH-quinone oxidoreductase subunit F
MEKARTHFLLCAGAGCVASGALEFGAAMNEALLKYGLADEVKIIETGCLGPCAVGPVAVVYPDGVFYQNLKPADAPEIVKEHLLKGRVVEHLVHKAPSTAQIVPRLNEIGFFREQEKIALRNCGLIDPLKIEEYIAREGYQALAKALTELTPEQIIETVDKSGLRGRGGAGFPTGRKWTLCYQAKGDIKYVLCNADEGDPGAFMDRSVLEGDPHSVIEAMAIAARAIGATQGYIYVRAEYPLAVERLGKALGQAREYGLIGKDILGTGFNFDLEIRMGSGAFVCGEETALMTSIEGNRGTPRPRPPFPANEGLWKRPSVLNNVETYANIPMIILRGAEWYASFGTDKSKGTKVFALAGAVNNTGLVEVPIGITLRRMIYDVGGGIPDGKNFKAAQLGGPSGGCLPEEHLDTPLDYETIAAAGAIMGSGGLIVMDETTCMVDMARFFMDFCQDESCGKCTPCRCGTKRMLEILERICRGEGQDGDIELLEELSDRIKDSALCGLGQTAPNPVLSTIRYFRHEYLSHIHDKFCPAGVCRGLYAPPCQKSCPVGVDVPAYNALIAQGKFAEALEVIRIDNPFPGVCGRLCPRACERNCIQADTEGALSIRALKRFVADHQRGRAKTRGVPLELKYPEKIAVVGAGPAGLSAARDLRREGYPVTVFEAAPRPGGMLRSAVPEFRLPGAVLDEDIQAILDVGVELRTGVKIGSDLTIDELRRQGYKAILVTTGADQGLMPKLAGLNGHAGVIKGIDFLQGVKSGRVPRVSGDVLVVGATYAALDAARSAVRLSAGSVGLIYPRDRDQLPFDKAEVREAEEEGVRIYCLHRPLEVLSQDGKVTGLKCARLTPAQPDSAGRTRAAAEGQEVVLPAQTIIFAVGQGPDLAFLHPGAEAKAPAVNLLSVNPVSMATELPDVYAAGDATIGGGSVIEAIGAGQKAAAAIHRRLRGQLQTEPYKLVKPRRRVPMVEMDEGIENFQRPEEASRPAGERTHDFAETNFTFSEMLAVCEARRCLRCGME